MSLKSAQAFVKKLQTDKKFRDTIKATTEDNHKKMIADAGFDFTKEELIQVMKKLSDDELKSVTGGVAGCVGDCSSIGCIIHW